MINLATELKAGVSVSNKKVGSGNFGDVWTFAAVYFFTYYFIQQVWLGEKNSNVVALKQLKDEKHMEEFEQQTGLLLLPLRHPSTV